jgi:hypothetical protein
LESTRSSGFSVFASGGKEVLVAGNERDEQKEDAEFGNAKPHK